MRKPPSSGAGKRRSWISLDCARAETATTDNENAVIIDRIVVRARPIIQETSVQILRKFEFVLAYALYCQLSHFGGALWIEVSVVLDTLRIIRVLTRL